MNVFTEHPHAVGETYFEHMRFALKFGGRMLLGGLAAIVHAVFPFFCITTASRINDELAVMRTVARTASRPPGG